MKSSPGGNRPAAQGPQSGREIATGRVDAATLASRAGALVAAADTLPGLLAAAFDAFEVIRIIARANDRVEPGGFPAFMAVAEAAVQGREAVSAAPSLPPGPAESITRSIVRAGDVNEVRAALAALAAPLASKLADSAAAAPPPGEREACAEAAAAATRIQRIMTGDGHGCLW